MSFPPLHKTLRQHFLRLLTPFLNQQPASRLIRRTAREQWRLLSVNLISNLIVAFTEGATLAVIYLAVEWLSLRGDGPNMLPPAIAEMFEGVPAALVFVGLMLLAVLLQIGQSLASYINRISIDFFGARCQARITDRIHNQILSFSFPCASHFRVGDLADQVNQGPSAVNQQIDLVNQILVGGLMLVMYLLILLRLSPWLMLVALVLGGLIALIQKQMLPAIRRSAWRVTDSTLQVSQRIIEEIQGLRLLHTSGQLEQATQNMQAPLQAVEKNLRRRSLLMQVIEPLSRLMPVLAFALIASLSVLVFQNRSSGVLPNLVTFMLALQRLNARMSGLATASNAFSDNSSRLKRLNGILEPVGKQFRRQGGVPFSQLNVGVHFDEVKLSYASDLPPALEGINFNIPKGSTVALVGGSGAGKSSIADLLVGLYSPSSGRILIDGIDFNTIDLSSWQQRIGVVSQDTFLFNSTLAENIAFGCPWASDADVANAAKRAQASGFIAELPEGFDTLVGERGYRLSGGQRQRISLARALLRRPQLLILDEATSALDTESERLVQQAIEAFDTPKTVLVIAHRLSTIINANQILVLEKGHIIERGGHSELLRARGKYSQLWLQQSGSILSQDTQPV